ncbi:MAG: D-glycerate dehydrogenase [Candidatus Thorarchaeota archaeon]
MKKKVFVTREIPDSGLNQIKKEFSTDIWEYTRAPTKDELIKRAQYCHGLVTLLSDPIDSALLDQLDQLSIIAQYAVGYDNIDMEAATSNGIMVTNTPGVLTDATADLTWALIMASARRIAEADSYVREGQWKVSWGPKMLLGKEVAGATLGIVGLGRIGSAVARRAKGFSMDILFHTRSETNRTRSIAEDLNARRVEFDELLQESDIVSLHVPLTPETEAMIDERELEMMKEGSILVNTSRGEVINEKALFRALKEGHLFAAGLDVFEDEPILQDNPLLQIDNVVLAPHIGSATLETRSRMAEICAENLSKGLKGERPPNLVNSEVLNHG